jgi:hypothetical protein
MKDITKKTFRYCLRESQGKGCLCAAMFNMKCDADNNILLTFKAEDSSYGDKTRDSWLVGLPKKYEMTAFYESQKRTFEFCEKTFPNENWYAKLYDWDDENLTCRIKNIPDSFQPDEYSDEFWKKQLEITRRMWDAGFINGNYPQGHYLMSNGQLILVVSYFGFDRGRYLNDAEISALNSCHKIQETEPQKNWFIKKYIHDRNSIKSLITDDVWRLTLASQYATKVPAFDTFVEECFSFIGMSARSDINSYINACLSCNTAGFEISYEKFKSVTI